MSRNPVYEHAGPVESLLYHSPLPTVPSVMIVDVPARHRGDALPLGRYYPIVIETDAERAELECALSSGWGEDLRITMLDHRPSNLWYDLVLISRYDPPQPGWPWVSVTRWPNRFRAAAVDSGAAMARGSYTMELFATAAELVIHWADLLEASGSRFPIEVRTLCADAMPPVGCA